MAPNGATDTAKRLMDDDDDFLLDVDDGVELAPAGSANLLWDPTKPSPLHHRRATAWTARQALSFAAVFALVAAIVGLGVARPDLLGNFRPAPVLAPYSSHFFRDAIQEQRFFCDRMYPLLRDLVHLPQSKFPLRLESGISSFGQPHLNMYLHANPDAVSDAVRKFGFYNKPKSRAVLHELDLFLAKHPHLSEDNIALFDIGANIGWFTFLAASRGFRVVAFEPLPSNELAMRMSICLNNLTEQVVLFNKGLSSTHRECPLFSGARNVGTGFVVGCGEVSGNGTKYSTGYLQEVQEELAGWKHQPDRYWSDDEVENGPDKKKFVPPWGISPDDLDWLPPRLRRRTLHALRSLDKRFKFKHRGKVELVRLDDVMSEFTDGWGKDTQLAVIKMDVRGSPFLHPLLFPFI